MDNTTTFQPVTMAQAPLSMRHIWLTTVSSMEQIIGAGLSTLAGIIIPMINLMAHPELSTPLQGLAGAAGLIGIAVGSPIIGRLADRQGYLFYFRACPVIIILGSLLIFFTDNIWCTIAGLFIAGIGTGGGYSLDSAYISELMPDRWRSIMVGIAKASSALGFIGVAAISYFIIKSVDKDSVWPILALTLTALGFITLLMRLRWAQSPSWCLAHGDTAGARKAVEIFFGKGVTYNPRPQTSNVVNAGYLSLFKGKNLTKVIFSGIPWACEGVGVYGVGVFLPVLVLALGIEPHHLHGLPKITDSVVLTAVINCFILLGFIIGLFMLRRFNHLKMLVNCFLLAALGLAVILMAFLFKLPMMISLAGFLIFELFLNTGPHLLTFIIPPQIFDAAQRAAGNGIAAFLGKAGAITGVFIMPWLLKTGGMTLVLATCIGVNLLGAFISWIFGRKLYAD